MAKTKAHYTKIGAADAKDNSEANKPNVIGSWQHTAYMCGRYSADANAAVRPTVWVGKHANKANRIAEATIVRIAKRIAHRRNRLLLKHVIG